MPAASGPGNGYSQLLPAASTEAPVSGFVAIATNLLEDSHDIRTVWQLLGHRDVQTTMVYTHAMNRGARGVHSPLDRLRKAVSSESGGIIRTDRSA